MCLIAYSRDGKLLPRDVFDYARNINSDGIGVVSRIGVHKFVGRRHGKRAWRHIKVLAALGVPYGVHFRWATHGAVTLRNCHPFTAASGAVVMHNGVIDRTASLATEYESDTALFVRLYMGEAPEPFMVDADRYYDEIGRMIGYGNKFLVYHPKAEKFTIVNEDMGDWDDTFWYSNTYSLPFELRPNYGYRGMAAAYGQSYTGPVKGNNVAASSAGLTVVNGTEYEDCDYQPSRQRWWSKSEMKEIMRALMDGHYVLQGADVIVQVDKGDFYSLDQDDMDWFLNDEDRWADDFNAATSTPVGGNK